MTVDDSVRRILEYITAEMDAASPLNSGTIAYCETATGETFELELSDLVTVAATAKAFLAASGVVAAKVEASSLGTPEAKALRATVSDEHARRIVARSKELERGCTCGCFTANPGCPIHGGAA